MANEKWGAGVANKLKNQNNLKGTAQEGKEGKEKGKRKRKRKRKRKQGEQNHQIPTDISDRKPAGVANEKWGAGVANKLKNQNSLKEKGTAQEGKGGKEKGKRKRKQGDIIIRFP